MQSKIDLIVERLKNIKPYKIILFGSKAYGTSDNDSDIDLIVVTNDDYLSKTYKEKSDVYLKVSNALTDLSKNTPIDLIAYTKPMYERFNKLGSLFSKEIIQKGKVLYEADSEGMAEQG